MLILGYVTPRLTRVPGWKPFGVCAKTLEINGATRANLEGDIIISDVSCRQDELLDELKLRKEHSKCDERLSNSGRAK